MFSKQFFRKLVGLLTLQLAGGILLQVLAIAPPSLEG